MLKICNTSKFKRKDSKFRSESSKLFFISGVISSNPSARPEKLRWPVMIVKHRKGQNYSKFLKTILNFNQILLKLNKLKSSQPFHGLKRLSSITILSFK